LAVAGEQSGPQYSGRDGVLVEEGVATPLFAVEGAAGVALAEVDAAGAEGGEGA
jgi:hypothetical protein